MWIKTRAVKRSGRVQGPQEEINTLEAVQATGSPSTWIDSSPRRREPHDSLVGVSERASIADACGLVSGGVD